VRRQQQAVFALPGNPVSALVCVIRYARPALLAAQGAHAEPPAQAVLVAAAAGSDSLTCFVPVQVRSGADGRLLAEPVPARTSGDFSALPRTHGVVELPPAGGLPAGGVAAFYRW
jgi:molybdopterin molybdotransferase